METMTMKVRPSEAEKYINTVSRFGWVLVNRIDMYDKSLDLGPYTPRNYKTKYRGKVALLNFERDPNNVRYAQLKRLENEYLSVSEDATKFPTSVPLIVGIVFLITGIIALLIMGGLSILGAMGIRLLVVKFTDAFNWLIDTINGILSLMNNILSFFGLSGLDLSQYRIEAANLGRNTGIASVLVLWGIAITSNTLFFFIPASILIFIGLIILFVRIIKYLVALGRNSKTKKVRKEVTVKIEQITKIKEVEEN